MQQSPTGTERSVVSITSIGYPDNIGSTSFEDKLAVDTLAHTKNQQWDFSVIRIGRITCYIDCIILFW